MKKIGFIDYYIDEWHAQNYPAWIKEASGGAYEVCYAYAKVEGTEFGKRTSAEWAAEHNVEMLASIEEVIQKSDALVMLSPDNPEFHEELAELALKSGKPVYVDKTFANTKAGAVSMFELAKAHNTPMYSSSALRYAAEYTFLNNAQISGITSFGGGKFYNYAVHQLEPLIMLMGNNAKRVMFIGSGHCPSMVVEFEGNRYATINQYIDRVPFGMCINFADGSCDFLQINSDFFKAFIKEMVDFFETRNPKVDPADTICIMAVREAGLKAINTPGIWLDI